MRIPYRAFVLLFLVMATAGGAVGCAATSTPTAFVSPVSPLATNSVLPTPVAEESPGDVFRIDEPLEAGDVRVSGSGPADLPIVVADLTLMGEVLGRGTIGGDGDFELQVTELITNHRVGIMLDPQMVEVYTADLLARIEELVGEGAIVLPHIGRVYASSTVK